MSFPFGKTATFIPQTVDNFGDRTAGTSVDVPGCAWWATPGVETVGGQDTVIYDTTLIAPVGTAVDPTYRVTLDGVTHEVVSEPIEWQSSLTGHKPGVEIHLRKVTG